MMKVAVIGGGSTYTPELVNGFLERADSLPVEELWLMDIDPERLEIVGGFAQRMVAARSEAEGRPLFEVRLTTNLGDAIAGSQYVITQLRVGGIPARREDEYLGRRHGLIGQETTGVGGMAMALRTIPAVLEVAAAIKRLAPGALLVNFANPAGLVTEALARHAPEVAAVGVCNVAITTKMELLDAVSDRLGIEARPERAHLDTLGLNHLSWHRGFEVEGREVWPQIIDAYVRELESEPSPEWDPALIRTLRMIPNYYLQYYYYTHRKLAAQQVWPPSRAEQVMSIERDLLAQYADPDLTEPPVDLMKRGGAYYSTVATQLLNAHHNGLDEVHVVNVPHRGAVAGWPADWVLEIPCRVGKGLIEPLSADPLPPVCFGLLAQVKSYELLTVDAAVRGDRRAAYEALLAHPLGPAADQVETVLEDLLRTNRDYLPQF
ncbi:MAG: 6-phospho-beta-glucosidase [Anaerolineae bacterium]